MEKIDRVFEKFLSKKESEKKLHGRLELSFRVPFVARALTKTISGVQTGYLFTSQPSIISPNLQNFDIYASISDNSNLNIEIDSFEDFDIQLDLSFLIIGEGRKL